MFTTAAKVQSPTAASDDARKIAPDFRSGLGLAMRAGIFSGLVGPPIGLLLLILISLPSTLSEYSSSGTLGQAFETPLFVATWGLVLMLPLMAVGAIIGWIAALVLGIPLALAEKGRGRHLPPGVWILAFGLFGLLFIPAGLIIAGGDGLNRYVLSSTAVFCGLGMLGGIVGSAIALRLQALSDGRILPRPWFTPGKLLWFGGQGLGRRRIDGGRTGSVGPDTGSLDVRWLDRWADLTAWSPKTNPALESKYMVDDHHEAILYENATPDLLAAAGAELLRYRFYPPQVAEALGEFDLEDRAARDGDRVLQRLRILHVFGLPILDILSMVEVLGIEAGPERWAFGYVTTERHPGRGWWRVALEIDADQGLRLTMTARSAPASGRISGLHGIRAVYRRIMRHYQARAHRRGIEAFRARVRGLAKAVKSAKTAEASGSAAASETSGAASAEASMRTEVGS